jgi:peroxiredoxin
MRKLAQEVIMALTYSTMLTLGTRAPNFSLPDVVSGKTITLADFAAKEALLVMFICQHCPYVKHIEPELERLSEDYKNKSLGIVAISSNSIESHPQDAPEHLKEMAQRLNFFFPLCFDESQEAAKAYTAACTPDFFLFDNQQKLVYRGQLDDSRPSNNIELNGNDLRQAIEETLAGQPVSIEQKPSIGCNIKWKPGNEPIY